MARIKRGIPLPSVAPPDDIDDVQTVDFDLVSLRNEFLDPITALRSRNVPALIQKNPRAQQMQNEAPRCLASENPSRVDQLWGVPERAMAALSSFLFGEPQESLAHTFIRMLGLPVVSLNGSLFNPGYNGKAPNLAEKAAQLDVAEHVSERVTEVQQLRESESQKRITVFRRQGIDAVAYGLVLPVFGNRLFSSVQGATAKQGGFASNTAGFPKVGVQRFSFAQRKIFLENNYERTNGESFPNFFDTGTHVLFPLVTNAEIAVTVDQPRLVCAPFVLGRNETFVEPDLSLPRPGIERILRVRSSDQSDAAVLKDVVRRLDPALALACLTTSELVRVAQALLGRDKIGADALRELNERGNFELRLLASYVRTLKAVVGRLAQAVETLRQVARKVPWAPLPSPEGPAAGTRTSFLVRPTTVSSEVQRRLNELSIRAAANAHIPPVAGGDIGGFATDAALNPNKSYTSEISQAACQKNSIERQGDVALRAVEMIRGEVSGLGLIDILAVYIGLWAVDAEVLVSLLDQPSFERLYADDKLRSKAVDARKKNGGLPTMDGNKAVEKLQDQVATVLAFADRLFQHALGSPRQAPGQSVT